MGAIERVKCQSCGQSWECRLGCGIMHGKLDTVLELFSKEIKAEVMKQVEKEMFPRFQFGYQLACCENCSAVVRVPVLELPKLNLKYVGKCEKCHREAMLMNVKEMCCPVCQNQQLETEKIGMWD